MRDRVELVDKNHPGISMRKQSNLLGLARSTMTYKPVDEDSEDIRIKRLLDEIYMKDPCLGSTICQRPWHPARDTKCSPI